MGVIPETTHTQSTAAPALAMPGTVTADSHGEGPSARYILAKRAWERAQLLQLRYVLQQGLRGRGGHRESRSWGQARTNPVCCCVGRHITGAVPGDSHPL